jgi:hypothetical protein
MKSWQSILINGCITVVVVFAAIGIFMPEAPPDKTKEIQESLDAQVKSIQLKLNGIEEAILKKKERVLISPAPGGPEMDSEALSKLEQKLDIILGKLSVLENQRSSTRQAPQTFGHSSGSPMGPRAFPPSLSAAGRGISSWIDTLSDDKKREVEIIFEEHFSRIRDKLPPPNPDGSAPDRKTVVSIIKENDLLLREELKTVLSGEEYQQFLVSHPEPETQSPKLPGMQRNRN